MNMHSARRLAEAAGGDTPAALASVLADMLTTLGPEYVDAMKAALGGGAAPSTSSIRHGAPMKLHATRSPTGTPLLTGRDREELDRAMGMPGAGQPRPGLQPDGRFLMNTMTPTEVRRLTAQGKL